MLCLSHVFGVQTAQAESTSPSLITESAFRSAADYSARNGGEALLIQSDGEVIFEDYRRGFDADKAHLLASGTKSFWGVAAAVMADEGLLEFDEMACETIGEWKGDPLKSKIRVRHLLNLTSGLEPSKGDLRGWSTKDKYLHAIGVECVTEPGSKFRYGPSHLYAFGELMKRKLAARGPEADDDPLQYMIEKIFDPIGMNIAIWRRDAAGNPMAPAGASLSASEWAKYGELLRREGDWHGQQIVSRGKLIECFAGSDARPAYGLTFWVREDAAAYVHSQGEFSGEVFPADAVMAAGMGMQRLYVVRSLGLVIVRFGNGDGRYTDGGLFGHLFGTLGAEQ